MPAYAAAATPAVTPGTISNRTPASASACASSLPRPNTSGSPPLSRTTRFPSAELHEQVVDRLLARRLAAAAALADVVHLDVGIVGARGGDDRRIGQCVGSDSVTRRQQLLRAHGEQAGVARSRADEVDDAAHAPAGRFEAGRAVDSSRASRSRSRRSRSLRLTTYAPYTSAASA